ncbi:MAG TPA: DNA polymerase III subunit delta' [Polyangiaceae bacterium]
MSFRKILGQTTSIEILTRAVGSERLHHAYRFEGPAGVGKSMAATALAQCLVCERPRAGLACCQCGACRRAATLSPEPPEVPLHPDVVWIAKGLYPTSVLGTSSPETSAIGIEQVRKMVLARVGYPSHEGRALVFIIRNAEELSQGAANALLKTLEEPPQRVHFVLLTSRPNRLLDTIRSRTLPIRFGALPDETLREIAKGHGVTVPEHVLPLAQGSAKTLLELANAEQMENRDQFVDAIRRAIAANDLAAALDIVGKKHEEREELKLQLSWVLARLVSEAKAAEHPAQAERLSRQHQIVNSTIRDLERNGQPALMLEAMLTRLRRV